MYVSLLNNDRLVLAARPACIVLALEDRGDGVRERLEEDGHLIAREHERLPEELEALDELRLLHLEVLRDVLDLLDEPLLRQHFLAGRALRAVELVPEHELERCGRGTDEISLVDGFAPPRAE